jgi:flagellar M-ring protein FliF
LNGLQSLLLKLGPARIFAALGVTAIVAAALFALMFRIGGEEKALLFSDLDMGEAGEITQRLDQAQIDYDLRGDGTSIFVPRSKVLSARLMLSEEGLPSRGSVGYEIFDRQDALGATQFQQNINRLRALEGELARTIASINGVENARVHLVLPERRLFERDAQQPSASIVVKLARAPLTQGQVRAVRNLVASAVPGLSAGRVTIADESGRLLAAADDGTGAGAAEALDERKTALETRLKNDVLAIVESVVGPGAARVEVNADVDFNRITQTSQTFDPEGRVVRQSTTREETGQSRDNGDGGGATAGRNVPDGASADAETGGPSSSNSATEENIRYEISNTTKTEIIEGGRVKRLSVAVAVDGVTTPGADGAAPTWAARDPQELERITALVRSAVGFDETRGDRVEVVNVRFAQTPAIGTEAKAPGLLDFQRSDVMRGVEILAALVAALAVIFFVLRPLIGGMVGGGANGTARAATGASAGSIGANAPAGLPMDNGALAPAGFPGGLIGDGASDGGIEIARIQGQVNASSVKKVADVIEEHPDETVQIIRNWLGERS